MRAAPPDVFALKNSGLEEFLYADVGVELNGSRLTILSVLSRLDKDPWAQAAGWAALPTDAAIDGLSQSIAQMPLAPEALAGGHDIAARLIQLLPGKSRHAVLAQEGGASPATAPNLSPVTAIWLGFVVWMVLSALLTPKTQPVAIVPIEPSMASSGPTSSAAVPLPPRAVTAPPAAPLVR